MSRVNKNSNLGWFRVKLFNFLPQNLKLQADKLWCDCFKAGKSQQKLEELEEKSFSVPFACILAIEKDSVIGALHLFKRKVKYNDKKILLGGIGGVCTKKEKRKIGVATALLREGIKELNAQKCDVAYLCTDINNPEKIRLYAQFGFVLLNKPYTYLGKSGKSYTEENGMVAPIQSKEKFELIIEGKESINLGVGNW